jgi:GMP synthase (glutamine-hydrolysing)
LGDKGIRDLTHGKPDGVAILDFGGQYCHLIARRIREMKVYSEIMPCDVSPNEISSLEEIMNVKGIILSGSPSSINLQSSLRVSEEVFEIGLPILGLCYGHQLIAHVFGGVVKRGEKREYGATEVLVDSAVGLLKDMDPVEKVWMSHGDIVLSLPRDFQVLAHTENAPVAAFRHQSIPIYGIQWHPEVAHTEKGAEMLRNFVIGICGCQPNWVPEDIIERAVEEIKSVVGDSRAIIAYSGGVDSSVAMALAAKALGERLVAVHVDHGFMRKDESKRVLAAFRDFEINLNVVDARERFLQRIHGLTDPEDKRKIIGEEFIRVFESEARNSGADYLIQGTIYPDRIESGFREHSDRIKTHHNVGGIPFNIDFKAVVEPLRDLYKDEVRALGLQLGLPQSIVRKQPFPGPGLAVRIIGEVTSEKLEILRHADSIVCEEIGKSDIRNSAWQWFAVLTGSRSTGVKGDERAYGYTVAIRIVESLDGMTANFCRAPWEDLERISTRITNEVPEVSRVVYDVTHKPPATIEWE